MSNNRLQPIVLMANQIAINLAHGKEQEQCILDITSHIQRFWAPSMRKQLLEAIELGEFEIEPLVKRAASQLTN
jgi:formate dehydrogenase subunit delta